MRTSNYKYRKIYLSHKKPKSSLGNIRLCEISVNMYLSPSFRNTRRDAKAILRHAAIMLDHPTLDSKFKLKPTIINFETTIELINRATLFQFQDSLPSIRLKKGTVHMLLLGGVDTSGPVTKGLAQANSICGGNNK